ncbi:GIY-YIG nuclease family protein [Streptomyces sp. NBC_01352]|uniref:GIY-YIG nuclease family protein n=1 Tax=Streptomyces sp. NBC_01352 TaxID=2903834 RepID=UPI002E347AD0|nr:GIY-YIG nuclease family protein [Streptomyces sp. NBC_01352]
MSYEDPGAPTALYRLYDMPGLLLYVGIAIDPANRLRQHHADQPWSFAISRQVVDWHPTRAEAAAAETAAIRTEGPVWNVSQADPARKHEVRILLWSLRDAPREAKHEALCQFAGMVPSPARAAFDVFMEHLVTCDSCDYPRRCGTYRALHDAYCFTRDAEGFTPFDPTWG